MCIVTNTRIFKAFKEAQETSYLFKCRWYCCGNPNNRLITLRLFIVYLIGIVGLPKVMIKVYYSPQLSNDMHLWRHTKHSLKY